MLTRLKVENYRCLENINLELPRLALLLGRNGSGKSSIASVLYGLRELLTGRCKISDAHVFPPATLTRWKSATLQQAICCELDIGSDRLTYDLQIEHDEDRLRSRIQSERLHAPTGPLFAFEAGKVQLYKDDHTKGPEYRADWTESALARVQDYGKSNLRLMAFKNAWIRMLLLAPRSELASSNASRSDELLARDGSNFASWYRTLVLEQPDRVQPYLEAIKSILPGFRSLRIKVINSEAGQLLAQFDHQGQAYEVPFHDLSSGERALLLLYAILYFDAAPHSTIVVDEPEAHLALAEIQPWLMDLSDRQSPSYPQVLLCSHHPELIDYLGQDHGIHLVRSPDGTHTVRQSIDLPPSSSLRLSEVIARGWDS